MKTATQNNGMGTSGNWPIPESGAQGFFNETSITKNDEGPLLFVEDSRAIVASKTANEDHARLVAAIEQVAEAVIITDTQGTIVYTNPAFEKSTGYTGAEALGLNPRAFKSGKQDADFYRQLWNTLKRGEVWHGHFTNKRKDGSLYEEEATISPIRDARGVITNYVAVERDVTREMQLEAQLLQSQKMEAIGTLAGGIAHDFNNILAIIQMQAGLIKCSADVSSEQAALANDITITVDRAASLARQLLLFSRRQLMQLRELDLNQAVSNMTKLLGRTLGETIEVRLNRAAEPMLIRADPSMMDQVLLNLAVNARDAMSNGGRLVIEITAVEFDELAGFHSHRAHPGSFVCLIVSDNGCGIPAEILPKIFEPFFTTKGIGNGTGLGLATAFGIVEQHRGWIDVTSEVGRGTTFRVYLPRLVPNAVGEIIPTPDPATLPGGDETILLVEDEPVLRGSLKTTLLRLGYRILEADTGAKALEVWRENRDEIRLLLTDLVMPDGIDGIVLARRLLQKNPDLKVVYMSGYSAELVGKELPLNEGANFLSKPFQVQKLSQTIRQSLDQPEGLNPQPARKSNRLPEELPAETSAVN